MKCLYCGKEIKPDEPCYDYFPVVGAETMGQCEACLTYERDCDAMDECRVVRDIERGGCGY